MTEQRYNATIEADVQCQSCRREHLITAETIHGSADEIGQLVRSSILDQMEADGWDGERCPDCAYTEREQSRADRNADGDREILEDQKN